MKQRMNNKNKKGSSLVFVIIAVAFVGILSTIILRATLINVETKGTDRSIKKNFYSAEAVTDKLNIALENISQEAMKKAYVDLLQSYAADGINTTDQNTIQNKFAKRYLNNLIGILAPGQAMTAANDLAPGVTYEPRQLKEYMKNALTTDGEPDVSDFIDMEDHDKNALLTLQYGDESDYDAERYLLLKNVKVKYIENKGDTDRAVSTWITTDIKMVVPKLNFEGGNIYPDFTKYAIIGNDKVDALNSTKTASVNGNVYAGLNGLNVSGQGDTLSISGSSSRLVTRGNINVQQSGGLTLGSQDNPIEVWAENYTTSVLKDSTSEAKLTVYGDSYVHDDLSLDGPRSNVKFLEGKYFGYSFNKNNAGDTDSGNEVNSQYSSAIVINGKHSSLFMGDKMSEILLGGRAFISRNQDSGTEIGNKAGSSMRKDIPIGESISVKSDQNFYLVSNDDLSEGFTNPMLIGKYKTLINAGKSPMSDSSAKTLKSYLNESEPVTNYVYDLSGTSTDAAMVYFYYNFKNQSAADRYFKNYCDKNEMGKKIVSSQYLEFPSGLDISISQNLSLLTVGNALTYSSKADGLQSQDGNITEDNEDYYKKESVQKAAKYKSYQLTLTDGDWSKYIQTGISDGEGGFDLTDKKESPIFDSLMTKDGSSYVFVNEAKQSGNLYGFQTLKNSIKYKAVPVDVKGKNAYAIFVVETNDIGNTSLEMGTEIPVGLQSVLNAAGITNSNDTVAIVVSNCNIQVDCNFRGLVISKNTVSFSGSNVKVTAESAMLQDMFSAQKSKEGSVGLDQRFLKYFEAFSGISYGEDVGSAQDSVDFSSCIKYVNWKKNNE